MLGILNLFGRSPFGLLRVHMEKVAACLYKLPELFNALNCGNKMQVVQLAEEISRLEHEADLTKNDIRNHLPKRIFLSIDRARLLEILALQDSLADRAEDIAVLTTLRCEPMPDPLQKLFTPFFDKNLEAFTATHEIIKELKELLEAAFGGVEAEKVRDMVAIVAYKEHEADLLQRDLLRYLFNSSDQLSASEFCFWQKVCSEVNAVANICESLANGVRTTLELK